jgi:acyl carrier protein
MALLTQSEFINEMTEICQAEPGSITMDNLLSSLTGWDSMAIIMFIAMVDEKLGLAVNVDALASCKTIGDLAGLCEGKVV